MNPTARRITTALAGLALAGSALATTGPAAVAGKPSGGGGGTSALQMAVTQKGSTLGPSGLYNLTADFFVPVSPGKVASITCTVDGVPAPSCGALGVLESGKSWTHYRGAVLQGVASGRYAVTITVNAGRATYTGSKTLDSAWTPPPIIVTMG